MKRIYFSILMFLLFGNVLLAQNYSISVKSNFDLNRKENWNFSLRLNGLQNITQGFALIFPPNTNVVPVQVLSGTKSFWLKKSDITPDSNNVIHWEKADSLLVFRFAPNVVFEGGILTVQLNLTNSRPGQAKGQLKWVRLQPNGRPGALLSQAEIQFQQSVTR